MNRTRCLFTVAAALAAPLAQADAVTDWNQRAIDFVVAAGLANQPAHRALAIAHTAAFEAAQAVTAGAPTPGGASRGGLEVALQAAISAAHCISLARLLPT